MWKITLRVIGRRDRTKIYKSPLSRKENSMTPTSSPWDQVVPPGAPTQMETPPSITSDAMAQFKKAYWNAFLGPVRALQNIADPAARYSAAVQLAQQGYAIDVNIMVSGQGPVLAMLQRQFVDLMTWIPNAMQPSIGWSNGGNNNPPYVPYDPTKPPPNCLKVSCNPADFPPASDLPPVNPPAPPIASMNLVGGMVVTGDYWLTANAAAELKAGAIYNGFKWTENGHEYALVVGQGLMGPSAYWQLVS